MDKLWTACNAMSVNRLRFHVYCIFLLAAAAATLLAGCEKTPADQYMLWKPAGKEVDRRVREIEQAYAFARDFRTIDSLTSLLEKAANAEPGNHLAQARAHFFRARYMSATASYADKGKADALAETDKALRLYSLIDAPDYDLFRLKYTRGKLTGESQSDSYTLNKEILDESLLYGDSLSMAGALNNIGNVLCHVGDTLAAIPYLQRSADIFRSMNLKLWEAKINLSLAIALRYSNPKKCNAILDSLYHSDVLDNDTSFRIILLHNMSVCKHDISYLKEICRFVGDKKEHNNTLAVCCSHIAIHYFEKGVAPDSAMIYADSAAKAVSAGIRGDYATSIYQAMALAARARGDNDSAYKMLEKYAEATKHATSALREGDVVRKENLSRIKSMENLQKDRDNRNKLIFMSVIFSIAILSMLAVMMVYRHNKRLQVSKMKADLELTRNRLQLASSRLALEENDNAMEKAIDTIARLRDSDRISRADASVMSSALRAQLSNRDELDAFQDIYNRLDPDFSRRLKEYCPGLSEGQIRMAAYIALGMNNRQIGRVMSIEYQSVIKARYRLRSRLGLDKTDSLEDFLRDFSDFDNHPDLG